MTGHADENTARSGLPLDPYFSASKLRWILYEIPDQPGAEAVQKYFDEMGRIAGRPWVMLSAGAGMTEFRNVLSHAYAAGASGYLAGRAIWSEAFRAFPDWAAVQAGFEGKGVAYMKDINALTDATAAPWWRNWGGVGMAHADGSFPRAYPGFGDGNTRA